MGLFRNLLIGMLSFVFVGTLHAQITQNQPKKLLFLGDSFTVGTGLEDGEQQLAFPHQLAAKLKANKVLVDASTILAVDGDTTKHLLGALNAVLPQSNPDNPNFATGDYDLVVLSIGINDLFRGHSLADYEHHFQELLKRAIRFAHDDPAKVIVLSIPAWDASPSVYDQSGTKFRYQKYQLVRSRTKEICIPIEDIHVAGNTVTIKADATRINAMIEEAKGYNTQQGIAKHIDSFNQAANAIAKQNKVHFIDLRSLTRINPATEPTDYPAMFAKDGIHYSANMYKKWMDEIYPVAHGILVGDHELK